MKKNTQTGRRNSQNAPSKPGGFFADGGEFRFLPADKPVFIRDALGRMLKITRVCEMDDSTLYFVAEIVRRESADGKEAALWAK
jgi:hypothetical protein